MSTLGTDDDRDELTAAERAEIARRYRSERGEQLFADARAAGVDEPIAVGEFASVPLEDFAAIPFVGALAAGLTALRGHRHGLPNQILLAIAERQAHAIERDWLGGRTREAKIVRSWERSSLRAGEVTRRSLRTRVAIAVEGEPKPLVLYATSLQLNPWAREVVRLLGGEVPDLVLDRDPAAGPDERPR